MKAIIFLILISVVESIVQTAPNISWQQVYGGSGREEATQIRKTTDVTFVAVSIKNSGMYTIRINSTGDKLWSLEVLA
jgi:hypothetical protein